MQELEGQVALRLQPSLLGEARRLAEEEGISLDQLVNAALAEKMAALRTDAFFDERASRADIPRALEILEKAGNGKASKGVFTPQDRDRVSARILELARADERVTAGAVVGSLAMSDGDRWSDLDLTFAVSKPDEMLTVLDSFAASLADEFGAKNYLIYQAEQVFIVSFCCPAACKSIFQ